MFSHVDSISWDCEGRGAGPALSAACTSLRQPCGNHGGGVQEQNLLGEGEIGAGVKCNGELMGLWGERGA